MAPQPQEPRLSHIWIATYVTFILWLLSLIITPLMRAYADYKQSRSPRHGRSRRMEELATPTSSGIATPIEGEPVVTTGGGLPTKYTGRGHSEDLDFSFKERMLKLTRACRDVFLVLFVISVVYTALSSLPYDAWALYWTIFCLGMVWILTSAFAKQRSSAFSIFEGLILFAFAVLAIVLLGLAFR